MWILQVTFTSAAAQAERESSSVSRINRSQPLFFPVKSDLFPIPDAHSLCAAWMEPVLLEKLKLHSVLWPNSGKCLFFGTRPVTCYLL